MLERRCHTTGNLDDCDFESDTDILFPTLFANNTRSFQTQGSSKINFPEYDEKIYEFDKNDEDSLKAFLELNPNKECLIKIIERYTNGKIGKPIGYYFYHSKILKFAFKNNKLYDLYNDLPYR